jgi:hypothetical protein
MRTLRTITASIIAIVLVVGLLILVGTALATVTAQTPVVPGTGRYVHTLNSLHRPSGKLFVDDEIIGPVDPMVEQSMDVAVIFSRKIPDTTRVCAETEMESKCVTLKEIRSLIFKRDR